MFQHLSLLSLTAAHVGLYVALLLGADVAAADITLFSGLASIGLIAASVIDLRSFRIPNPVNAYLLLTGLVSAYWFRGEEASEHALGAILWFLVLWALSEVFFRLRGKEGFGLGDVKLMAAGVAWVGPIAGLSVLMLASCTGIVVILATRLVRRTAHHKSLSAPLPFGPFLALAIWWVWLYGPVSVS